MSIRFLRCLLPLMLACVLLSAGSVLASAAPGDLDPTFGSGGTVVSAYGARGNALALQTDGKLVVVGQDSSSWVVSRFNPDGSPDTSFGTGGEQTLDLGNGAAANAVVMQADGKIVVAGTAEVAGRSDFGIARLNADGSLDTSFGSSGVQTTDFGVDAGAVAVGLQSDGKIVVGGYTAGNSGDVALARYNSDGSLDTSFGNSGTQTTDLGGNTDTATGLAIQSDDKIVVSAFPGVTLRYTADGALDPTFGGAGMVTTTFDHDYNTPYDPTLQPHAVTLQADGKIVVVGDLNNAATDDPLTTGDDSYGIVRYNPDGSLDTTFSHDGKQAIGFLFGQGIVDGDLATPRAVSVESDGRLVIAGWVIDSANYDFGLIRVNPNGQLDLSFANNGRLLTSFPQTFASSAAVAIQPDGSIVAGGYTADMDNSGNEINQHLAIARYQGGGPPPGPQPPRNVTPPYIAGTPVVGEFVEAPQGFWLGDTPLTYTWQWLRDGQPIPQDNNGNNGQASLTYPVAPEDAGQELSVQVTATNESGSASFTTAAVMVSGGMGGGQAPMNTALPQIAGTPAVGATLSASTGAWSGDQPMTYSYQWLRDGSPIADATGSSYVVDAADQGHQLAVEVTATNLSGNASATSPSVSVPATPPSGGGQTPGGGGSSSGGGQQSGGGSSSPPPTASIASVGRVSLRGSSVVVQLHCSGGSGCLAVTATLSLRERLRGGKLVGVSAKVRTRVVVIGKATARLAAGQSKQLTVRLNRTGQALLKRFRKLKTTLRVAEGSQVMRRTTLRFR